MEIITYKDYLIYREKENLLQLKEDETQYNLFENPERNYDEKEVKEVDKKHDKMFRNILQRKKEMAQFLNQFLDLGEYIDAKQIEQCSTDFITKQYQNKQSDILYRQKQKPIYFLVEHQSTVDMDMAQRNYEYMGEIVRKERILQNIDSKKEIIYPIVVPIVIYTGQQKWKAKTNFADKQYTSDHYNNYKIHLKYNLIAIQDYTFKELQEKRSLLADIMIIEKCETIEQLVTEIEKMLDTIYLLEDRETLAEIIEYIIAPRIGKKATQHLLEKIRKKEEIGMSP